MDSETEMASGLLLTTILLVIFIVMKLTGVINWSWWWVLSPVWMPLAVAALLVGGLALMVALKVLKK